MKMQIVGYVWTGFSGRQYAELAAVPAESARKIDYFLYREEETDKESEAKQ